MPPCPRVPSCRVKASRDDATVPARFQPVVAAPRIRCHRVCASPNNPRSTGSHRPHDFLATGNYPLSTIHYPLQCRTSGPAVPCKRRRNVLYCKVEPEHNQAGPERAACTHLPAHHDQAANHVDLLRTERPNPAHSAQRSRLSRYQPEMRRPAVRRAAHPQGNDTRHAAHAGAAGIWFCILSRKARSCRCFAHFLHPNDTFCAFLRQIYDKNGREMPTSVSCYESPCQYPVTRRMRNFSKLGQTGQNKKFDTLSMPYRYPISAVSQPLYDIHGRSWAYSGQSRPHSCALARRYRQGDLCHH